MPAMPPGVFRWHTRATDARDVSDPEWGPFRAVRVNAPPGTPTITAPSAGERRLLRDGPPAITASAADADSNLSALVVIVDGPDGYRFTRDVAASGGNSASVTPTAGPSGSYTARVTARDACGSTGPQTSRTYRMNTPPGTPTQLSPSTGFATNRSSVTLGARYADPDGDSGNVDFLVVRPDGTSSEHYVGPYQNGASAYFAYSAAAEGTYRWQVRGWDGDHSDGGEYRGDRTFVIDRTGPPAPPITSSSHAQANHERTFTAAWQQPSDATGVADYAVVVDQSPTPRRPARSKRARTATTPRRCPGAAPSTSMSGPATALATGARRRTSASRCRRTARRTPPATPRRPPAPSWQGRRRSCERSTRIPTGIRAG